MFSTTTAWSRWFTWRGALADSDGFITRSLFVLPAFFDTL
jgi:hypothetical protein